MAKGLKVFYTEPKEEEMNNVILSIFISILRSNLSIK